MGRLWGFWEMKWPRGGCIFSEGSLFLGEIYNLVNKKGIAMKILESKLRRIIKSILLENEKVRTHDSQNSVIDKLWSETRKSGDIFKDIQTMCKENARESSCGFKEIGRVDEKSDMFIKSIKPHNKNNEVKKKLRSADFNIESTESSMRSTDGFCYFMSLVIDEICEEGQIFRVE